MAPPILQFGTGRFLQAHVDLFVSEAHARGEALGGIAVVQTTDNEQSTRRLDALARGEGYRVDIRGLHKGERVDESVRVTSVHAAWAASRDWQLLRDAVAGDVQVIVSNTADAGYALSADDDARCLHHDAPAPRSFPAKLLALLRHRWELAPQAALTLLPCELVPRNGDVLKGIVLSLAREWQVPEAFIDYLDTHCVWLNSLVDRIVSQALEPVGAVAEPYALWAIEPQPRMVLPCRHPAIVVSDELVRYERLKLMLLNLGHTFLAERWQRDGRAADETVLQAMGDAPLRAELEAVWSDEVLPVFDALGMAAAAREYLDTVRDRLCNPFLAHRLSDIAQNHEQKKLRRIAPVLQLAQDLKLGIAQSRLRACHPGK